MFPTEVPPSPRRTITPIPLPRKRQNSVSLRDGYVTPNWVTKEGHFNRHPSGSICLQPPAKRKRTRSAMPSGPLTKEEDLYFSDVGRFPETKTEVAVIDGVEYEVGYTRSYIKKKVQKFC